jgi:hypothetical protein
MEVIEVATKKEEKGSVLRKESKEGETWHPRDRGGCGKECEMKEVEEGKDRVRDGEILFSNKNCCCRERHVTLWKPAIIVISPLSPFCSTCMDLRGG